MIKKLVILLSIIILLILGYTLYDVLFKEKIINPQSDILSPLAKKSNLFNKDKEEKEILYDTELKNNEILNILLLGIDRRSKLENSYRTDVIILVTIDKSKNNIVLTSIPRDLWYKGSRINAIYINSGFDGLKKAIKDITGFEPDRFILTDFEDFSWIINQFGGVPVDVEISFTDKSYPVDATKGYQTISFTKGKQIMNGERALIFSRSRKGDFDNGDWGRMKRQHLILKGILKAATQPNSFVCKDKTITNPNNCKSEINTETIRNIYNLVTKNRMDTNFKVNDLSYLWDFYKQREDYQILSLLLDYNYLYTPPMEEYGGAWVLAPKNGSYTKFRNDLNRLLLEGNLENNVDDESNFQNESQLNQPES